jgi:hypothetical protein
LSDPASTTQLDADSGVTVTPGPIRADTSAAGPDTVTRARDRMTAEDTRRVT